MTTAFVTVGDRVVAADEIYDLDLTHVEEMVVDVSFKREGKRLRLEGHPALDLVMQLRPSALEGRRFRHLRHAWAFHNLVAHPGLQILSWLGLHKLGFRLHDATVPRPRGPR